MKIGKAQNGYGGFSGIFFFTAPYPTAGQTELLSEHLQDCGYTAYIAQNGGEVLEKLHLHPDLILLDIGMPGMDGLELCGMIRDHVACLVLFLTARITEQDKICGLQAGGDDYITKPFSLQELTARIAAHLRRDERSRRDANVVSSHGLLVDLTARTVCLCPRLSICRNSKTSRRNCGFSPA